MLDNVKDLRNADGIVASKPVDNHTSKLVMVNSTGELIFTQLIGQENIREFEVEFEMDGSPYFTNENGEREFLNEFSKL